MRRIFYSFFSLALFFALVAPTHAAVVSTQKCSAINPGDGITEDWAKIPYLVDETIDRTQGTVYYLDAETDEWVTTEPETYRYKVNMDQWSKIEKMKTCNTAEDFYMMMSGGWPMFSVYDTQYEGYIEASYLQHQEGEQIGFSLPHAWNYWMVWKMQKADGSDDIIYFAADIGVDENLSQMQSGDHPQLYLYKESDDTSSFVEAAFNPNTDTLLTEVEVSHTGEEGSDCVEGEECEFNIEDYVFTDLEDQAFEVQQDITQLFKHAPFGYADEIKMSVAMYADEDFSGSSLQAAVTDESDPVTFTFSKRGVLNARVLSDSITEKKATLKWKKFKTNGTLAKYYDVRVYNTDTGKLVKKYKAKNNRKKIEGLKAGTPYRAIIRARQSGEFSSLKKSLSAWSSSVRFTTAE